MKFSVLIPAYNAENFIAESIMSVMNQTYPNWEMIIVNDGSTDNTLSILKDYEKKDKRIKIINQENKGSLMARRVAIEKATGDYICFLDSDDFWENNMLEVLVSRIKQYNPDLILFNHNVVNLKGEIYQTTKHIYNDKQGPIKNESLLSDFLMTNKLNNVWAKVVSKKLLDLDVRDYSIYGRLMQSDDRLQSLSLIYNSSKTIYIDETFYNYRTNPESITHNYTFKNLKDTFMTEVANEKFLIENNVGDEYLTIFYNHFIYYSLGAYLRLIGFQKTSKVKKKEALKILNTSEIFKRAKPYLKGKNKYIYRLIKKERILSLDLISFINKKRIGL